MSRIYVGTYAKYNAGSIQGAWLDLEDYADAEEFNAACRELHKDEHDPELMFQDWEEIPDGMVSESSLSADVWDWLELDEDDRELLAVYQGHVDQNGDIDTAREALCAKGDSRADIVQEWHEDAGYEVPDWLQSHVDWDSVARDMEYGDYVFVRHDGEVWMFNRNC